MKKIKKFIQLFLIVGLLFAVATACDKTDVPGGDFPSAGTVKDADNNMYNTVKIGTQVWTVENLKTTKYKDGTPIPNITDSEEWASLTTGAYCIYDNLESNADTYGRLYNWYAVNTGKLAPEGWRVPTDDDWIILKNYLITKGYNYNGKKDINALNQIAKSLASTSGWELSNYPGTPGANPENNNITGFTAFPYGRRDKDGIFDRVGKSGYWWSSTKSSYDEKNAYCQAMGYNAYPLEFQGTVKEQGFSVRLVKD